MQSLANDWAKLTLELHAKDKRPYLYSLEQLDNFKTHDQLWNAAQIQMRVEGKMHGKYFARIELNICITFYY